MITVYVGGWNEFFSDLRMTHINLPATQSSLSYLLSTIGVNMKDAQNGSDYYIKGIRSEFSQIAQSLNFTDDLQQINRLAQMLSNMDELDRDKLNAACMLKKCDGPVEILALAAHLDQYEYLPAGNDEELGEFEVEAGNWKVPIEFMDNINYTQIGQKTRQRQGGLYDGIGYICETGTQNNLHNHSSTPFEERYNLLCKKAQKDYDEYMSDVSRMDGSNVISEGFKMVVMEEMLSQIQQGQFSHPFDVELLLYHDNPLLAAYEQFEQSEFGISQAINEDVNEFLAQTRNSLAEMESQYDSLPPEVQARVLEHHNRHLAVFDVLQKQECEESGDWDDELDR